MASVADGSPTGADTPKTDVELVFASQNDDKVKLSLAAGFSDSEAKDNDDSGGGGASGLDKADVAAIFGNAKELRDRDWRLSFGGYPCKIINDGKTFRTSVSCIARTDGTMPMLGGSGIYKIVWNVERLDYQRQNGIGICTGEYLSDIDLSRDGWAQGLYHVGWDFGGPWSKDSPNGLLCGWNYKKHNIFFKNMQFIGPPLPKVQHGDIVGLIYDSNERRLLFMKNYKPLPTQIILKNIDEKPAVYWFVGKRNYTMQMSIVKLNRNFQAARSAKPLMNLAYAE